MTDEQIIESMGFVICKFPPDSDPCENCQEPMKQMYFQGPSDAGRYLCKDCIIEEYHLNVGYGEYLDSIYGQGPSMNDAELVEQVARNRRYCNGCVYIDPDEHEQLCAEPHICTRLNMQVYHCGMHPKIPRPDKCRLEFSALVEENATLEQEREELRAELQKWCDSRDGMMSLVEKLESENAVLKKQLKPIEEVAKAMEGGNPDDFVYGMSRSIQKCMELKEVK